MQLMTQAEYARHRRVSKPAVSNWKKQGLLVLVEEPGTGRIKVDRDRTDAKVNARVDPMRGRPPVAAAAPSSAAAPADPAPSLPLDPASTGGDSFADERKAYTREQRIGQAMKNAQLAGELVPLIEAERRVEEAARACRERVQSWFRGEAERLAAERDIRAVMTLGEEGIDRVFSELADMARRGDFADDVDDELTAEEEAEMEAAAEAEAE